MTRRVVVLGTCTSEDWYFHQNVRNRLDAELARTHQHSTLVSTMAEPVEMTIDPGTELTDSEAKSLRMDFDKTFLASLASLAPDVMIVDFLLDGRRGVVSVEDSWISNTYILERTPMRGLLSTGRLLNPRWDPQGYFEMFADAAQRFNATCKALIPSCRVVLHQARWAESYLDAEGALHAYAARERDIYATANLRIAELESIFLSNVDCEPLHVDDVAMIADVQHIWGLSAAHYQKSYYASFCAKLRSILDGLPD